MKNVHLVRHPLIDHSLTVIRNSRTRTEEFRKHAGIISKILIVEATKDLAVGKKIIQTPLSPYTGRMLKDDIVVVPVLRAGLAMLFALQDFLPAVRVGFIGLERDEKTAIAREYYRKIPRLLSSHIVLVIDPMLATGGSFDNTLTILKQRGAKRLIAVSVVSAVEGLERVSKNHPDVPIYIAAIDEKLNDKAYIVPGLGDFGDRYFGTETIK